MSKKVDVKENSKVKGNTWASRGQEAFEGNNENTKQVEDFQIQRNNEGTKVTICCLEIH